MFFAIIFIAIGAAILLNALGLFGGSFWGIFWGVVFIVVGFRMMRKNGCPMCEWKMSKAGMFGKIHAKMHGGECCDQECCDEECCEKVEKPKKK